MRLYHGTTASVAGKALSAGLLPREATGLKSNWQCESSPHLVYLTETYAGYFANSAVAESGEAWGIVEVDTDLLDASNMLPDEDFLEQATRGQKMQGLRARSMSGRTKWFRERIHGFAKHWEDSLRGLGNAAHCGPVPPEAITRTCIFVPSTNKFVSWSCIDPVINLMNHRFMGDKYRGLCRWFFEELSADELEAVAGNVIGGKNVAECESVSDELLKHAIAQRDAARKALSERSGLTIACRT